MTGETIWEDGSLRIVQYHGAAGAQASSMLAQMRINYFCVFPYLYKGNLENEKKTSTDFALLEGARIILSYDDKQVIGVATHIPLVNAWKILQIPFIEKGLNPNKYHYFGESIITPSHRGMGLSKHINKYIEDYAKKLNLSYITAMTVIRNENHPFWPREYTPFENYMYHFNYERLTDMSIKISWPTMPDGVEREHELEFWQKQL